MQGHNFKFHIIKIFDSRGELLFPGHKTYFLLIQCAIVPLIEKQSLVLNSAFLSNNLIKFGAFILGQNKLFWSNWSPLGDSQGLSLPLHPANFTCLKELLDLALCHICQLQSLLWPFILGECLYLHAKMTKIQTGHSSLSASNGAEMLQKHFLCHQGEVFYYVPLATLVDPVLLSPSLLGNCLEEPYEETPPIPGATGVGQMCACHLVGGLRCLPMQRVGARACRRLSQAAAPRVDFQLTPNFTFHGQKAHFSWLNRIDPVFSKCYVLIKEWIKPLNSGSLTPPSYSCWTATLLIVFCLVAHRSSCWWLPCLGTYFGMTYFDYCRCSYLLFSD